LSHLTLDGQNGVGIKIETKYSIENIFPNKFWPYIILKQFWIIFVCSITIHLKGTNFKDHYENLV